MNFKDLLDSHEKIEVRVNAYWTFWSVIVVAIAGWTFSAARITDAQLFVVAAAFAVFAAANLGVLIPATRLAVGLRDELRSAAATERFASDVMRDGLERRDPWNRLVLTVALHLAVDVLLIAALMLEVADAVGTTP